MAVALLIELPGVTRDQYEQTLKSLGLDTTSEPPPGQILHLAGPIESGWQVVDVWESRADFERFLDQGLARAFKDAGIPTPRVTEFPVYKVFGLPKTVGAGMSGMRS